MRLTTKIVLGIILGIFLLAPGLIIGFSFTDRKNYYGVKDKWFEIPQDNMEEIGVNPYKTIFIDKEAEKASFQIYVEGTAYLQPVSEGNNPDRIFMPEELKQYCVIESRDDTLFICLKIKDIYNDYKTENDDRSFFVRGLNFYMPSSDIDLVCKMGEICTEVKNIKAEKIKIDTHGMMLIDSCDATTVQPFIRGHSDFKIKNSKVKELNIDLDYINPWSWSVENCDIEVENLTGNSKYDVRLSKSEARIINWNPKNENAKLQVTLYGDTAKIMFP